MTVQDLRTQVLTAGGLDQRLLLAILEQLVEIRKHIQPQPSVGGPK